MHIHICMSTQTHRCTGTCTHTRAHTHSNLSKDGEPRAGMPPNQKLNMHQQPRYAEEMSRGFMWGGRDLSRNILHV